MIDFEPVEVRRGDGKTFWQPQCNGARLWRYGLGASSWYDFPEQERDPVYYRSKWFATLRGKWRARQFYVTQSD